MGKSIRDELDEDTIHEMVALFLEVIDKPGVDWDEACYMHTKAILNLIDKHYIHRADQNKPEDPKLTTILVDDAINFKIGDKCAVVVEGQLVEAQVLQVAYQRKWFWSDKKTSTPSRYRVVHPEDFHFGGNKRVINRVAWVSKENIYAVKLELVESGAYPNINKGDSSDE